MADRFDQCPCARLLGMEVAGIWPGGARVVMETGIRGWSRCALQKKRDF